MQKFFAKGPPIPSLQVSRHFNSWLGANFERRKTALYNIFCQSLRRLFNFSKGLAQSMKFEMGQISDSKDLASFGYQQQLDRSLGSFSVFAAGFSYISILTGMFQVFYLGYGAGGPAFFWTWPIVLAGQTLVALCFAELAGRYPLSGGVYQWAKHISAPRFGLFFGPLFGWITGCIYLLCLIATLAAVALALENTLPLLSPFFHVIGNPKDANDVAANGVFLGCIIILISSIVNAFGVRLLAVINNIGVFSEIVGVVLLILILSQNAVRSPSEAVFQTLGKGEGSFLGYLGPFLVAAALTPAYVMYGFDTAGTLAEETKDPRRRAPRAILQALLAAGMSGLFLLLFGLMAARDLTAPSLSLQNGGLSLIVEETLGPWAHLFLWDVIFAITVCVMAVHSGIVRLIFALARDGHSPLSLALAKVSPTTQTPVLPTFISGLLAIFVLVGNFHYPKVVELITSLSVFWANLAYFIVVGLLLAEKSKKKGGVSLPVNIAALCWSGFMVINVGWPREYVYGRSIYYRFAPLWLTFGALVIALFVYLCAHWWEPSSPRNLVDEN
jgi:urea carboxylase system permease